MGMPVLDPKELLDRLRSGHRALQWGPVPPDEPRPIVEMDLTSSRRSLQYLHQHWALPDNFDPAVAGAGVRGRLVALFGRLTYRVLGPYLNEERALISHMVQAHQALEERCDDLTLRYRELREDIVDRQVAEAENQAKLALWLQVNGPSPARSESPGDGGDGSAESAESE